MIVAGIMSGTSADGVNVAVLQVMGKGANTRFKLLAHEEFPYPMPVRKAILAMMNAASVSVADISRMEFLLPELYAEAVRATRKKHRLPELQLIGCHGQTLYHQGERMDYLGKRLAVTWQAGDGSVLAARTNTPVVSDFRTADMAAGGKGAPLVPFLDYMVYRHRSRGRILQNLGGIGNLTAIPAGADASAVIAFDTGPSNMVIDQCMERFYQKSFDRNGTVAAKGKPIEAALKEFLRDPYYRQPPPKTAGREEYGREFMARFFKACKGARKEDVVATATALTARTIAEAISRFVLKRGKFHDYVVAGGGARNPVLLAMIEKEISRFGLKLRHSDEFGVPAEAKEAIAFAVMAYETWHRRPSNVPSATGASRPAILGKISYV